MFGSLRFVVVDHAMMLLCDYFFFPSNTPGRRCSAQTVGGSSKPHMLMLMMTSCVGPLGSVNIIIRALKTRPIYLNLGRRVLIKHGSKSVSGKNADIFLTPHFILFHQVFCFSRTMMRPSQTYNISDVKSIWVSNLRRKI